MGTLTIDLLTDGEKYRAREILRLIREIETRRHSALCFSLAFTLLLMIALLGADAFLFSKHNISLLNAIGLSLNSGYDVAFFFLLVLIFTYSIYFPIYAAIFLPRARLRVLRLKELAWQEDEDAFFGKLKEIRALTDLFPAHEIEKLSNLKLDKEILDKFLANAIRNIKTNI